MIGKNKIERMCRAAGCPPVHREMVNGTEVFIADGFAADPTVFRKFLVERADFPFGVFGTFWWTFKGDEKMSFGRPLFFDAFHDAGHSKESKQKMRIRAAVEDATVELEKIKNVVKH